MIVSDNSYSCLALPNSVFVSIAKRRIAARYGFAALKYVPTSTEKRTDRVLAAGVVQGQSAMPAHYTFVATGPRRPLQFGKIQKSERKFRELESDFQSDSVFGPPSASLQSM